MASIQESNTSKPRMRSPSYPLIGLESAIAKSKMLYEAQKKFEAHVDTAIKTLGFATSTGPALRTISALDQYGLIEQTGAKDLRKVKITDLARDILELPPTDPRYSKALKTAALSPTIHQSLWERYGLHLPDGNILRAYLIRDKEFNEAIVDLVMENYRSSLSFAKLDKTDTRNDDGDLGGVATSALAPGGYSPSALVWNSSSPATNPPPTFRERGPLSPQSNSATQELPILVDDGQIARIPFPMSEDAFQLLIGTLQLWKKRLVPAAPPKLDPSNAHPPQPAIGNLERYPTAFGAIWRHQNQNKPVQIIGIMRTQGLPDQYMTDEGIEIPTLEVSFS